MQVDSGGCAGGVEGGGVLQRPRNITLGCYSYSWLGHNKLLITINFWNQLSALRGISFTFRQDNFYFSLTNFTETCLRSDRGCANTFFFRNIFPLFLTEISNSVLITKTDRIKHTTCIALLERWWHIHL